jgi:nitroreductase
MDYDSLLELVKTRRSIRRIKPDPVPDDYIDKIIEVARWAPSGFNSQPWDFIIVKDQDLKSKLAQLVTQYRATYGPTLEAIREPWMKAAKPVKSSGQLDWTTAPVFIILCGDTRAKIGLPMTVRSDYLKCESIFDSSLANAFLYMHLAATTLGLASIWVSPVKSTQLHLLVKHIIGIPDFMEIYDMMALAFPATKPRPKLLREKKSIIHSDYCGIEKFRSDEEVKEFIKKNRNWALATIRKDHE